jgi:hypothetical protein
MIKIEEINLEKLLNCFENLEYQEIDEDELLSEEEVGIILKLLEYKDYDTRTDIESTPTDAASALSIALHYSKQARNAESPELKQKYEDFAQRFFDSANRFNDAARRKNPNKHKIKRNSDMMKEEIEVNSLSEAINSVLKNNQTCEIELDEGMIFEISPRMAKEITSQHQTEEELQENAYKTILDSSKIKLRELEGKSNTLLHGTMAKKHNLSKIKLEKDKINYLLNKLGQTGN